MQRKGFSMIITINVNNGQGLGETTDGEVVLVELQGRLEVEGGERDGKVVGTLGTGEKGAVSGIHFGIQWYRC
jgi:hypothetical protein